MACAACTRRYLALSIQSIPGCSTRARVPRYFAAPQLQRLLPTQFSTLSALRFSNAATFKTTSHVPTTGNSTQLNDENSEAVPTATVDDSTKPGHETASSPSDTQADAEPSLAELQEDLGTENEQDQSLDAQLFVLTGRRPGETSSRLASDETTLKQMEMCHKRENLIAKLVMGEIGEEDAAKELKQLEPQKAPGKRAETKRQKPMDKGKQTGRERSAGEKSWGDTGTRKFTAPQEIRREDRPARARSEAGKPEWKKYKQSLEKKFEGASWRPAKRVSPDAVLGIRDLHKSDPQAYNIEVLANHFKISKEAVRRILKSKFTPNEDEMKDKRGRWQKRGEKVWKKLSDMGVRPPKKWREMGVSQGPAPWKKGTGGHRPREAGYAWDEEHEGSDSGGSRNSFVGRIE